MFKDGFHLKEELPLKWEIPYRLFRDFHQASMKLWTGVRLSENNNSQGKLKYPWVQEQFTSTSCNREKEELEEIPHCLLWAQSQKPAEGLGSHEKLSGCVMTDKVSKI